GPGQRRRSHRIHGDLHVQTLVRAIPSSIVPQFDRIIVRSNGYIIVVSRGSDILATRRTDVWDLEREPLLSTQHARTRTRKVIRWRKPPWGAPQQVLPTPIKQRRPDLRDGRAASRKAACRSSSPTRQTGPIPITS